VETLILEKKTAAAPYWIVGLAATIAHLALLILDARATDGFFRADRASQRFHAMRNLIESGHDHAAFVACLVRQGNIGDYGIHAAFYWLGGPLAVISFQVLLAIAAALCVTYIAWRAFASRNIAIAGGVLYAALPQTLAFPHQLLSESIANPFIIFGTAGLLRALEHPRRTWSWILSGLAMGIGGMVRPALILLPLVAAGILLWLDRERVRSWKAGIFALSGLAPFLLWGVFMFVHVGKFGPGESNQDLGLNFSQSTAKVLLSEGLAPADGRPPDWLPKRLTLGEYLRYIRTYPTGFANLYMKNTLVMVTDSGIGRLYVDLLGFGAKERIELQDPSLGWRAQLTNHGPLAMLRQGWELAPGTILVGVAGALGFALVNFGTAVAYLVLLRRNSSLRDAFRPLQQRWCLAFLLVMPVYVLATSQVVAYAPSRLRSQAEFAWAILACFGWASVRNFRRAGSKSITAFESSRERSDAPHA
jgi:4-amino-4-deoxy-L-arabinose transferase-like glycosyltransferase